MQKREKQLAGAVGLLAVLFVGQQAYSRIDAMLHEREQQVTSLSGELSKRQMQVTRGQRARRAIAVFEARSLPSEPTRARSLYQNYLGSLLQKSGLVGGVTSQDPRSRQDIYTRFAFNVSAKGTLEQLTQFLHAFYERHQLHQITAVSLKADEGGKQLSLLMSVEAISLPTADPNSLSTPRRTEPLPAATAYREALVGRNFFAAYVPPPPPRPAPKTEVVERDPPPPRPTFDAAKHTYVSSIVGRGDEREVWLNDRTSGNVLQLARGASFKVGTVEGTISQVQGDQVIVTSQGKRWLFALGDNLKDGTPLSDGDL